MPEVAQDVIPRLESLMEDWTESQVRDYLKYTLEGAYSTRLPLEEDQIKDEATLLVRTGQTAKCIVFRRTSNGIHILVNPPSMQPDPRLAIESGLSPRDRLVKTTTKRRNGWKLPGGRANAVDVDLAKTQPFPSQTGVLLMTALREMTEEFGHCMQVVLKHDDAHFSYDTSTEALIEFDMKFERPMLLLYAHRTHGPEVWESERVGKYPGVTRRSKVMFILGEVLDPLQQLPLNAPMYEEEQLDRRPHRWWPYSAVVHDDWIARGILPNMQIEDILPLENTPAFIPSPLHRRSLLDMQHWVTSEGTGILVSVNDKEDRTGVETSEDKTMVERQEKLDTIERNIEQVGHNSLPIRNEREIFDKLMSWPAQDEKALVDYTKVRHEGGEKSAMFGFRYRIPKRTTMLQTVYGLTALEARSRLKTDGSDSKRFNDEELLRELFEKEYGRQPEPFLEFGKIEKAVKDWVKENPDLAVNRTNMTDFLNLWLTSIQSLSLYACNECGAAKQVRCVQRKNPTVENFKNFLVSIKRNPSLLGSGWVIQHRFSKRKRAIALVAQISFENVSCPFFARDCPRIARSSHLSWKISSLVSSLIQRVYNVNKKKISPNWSTDSTGSFMHTSVRKDKDLAFRLFIAQDICNTSSMWSHSWPFCEAM